VYRQPQIDASQASLDYQVRADEQILLRDRFTIKK
jgi:hypothetical protein